LLLNTELITNPASRPFQIEPYGYFKKPLAASGEQLKVPRRSYKYLRNLLLRFAGKEFGKAGVAA
jgi:hypothetical protein